MRQRIVRRPYVVLLAGVVLAAAVAQVSLAGDDGQDRTITLTKSELNQLIDKRISQSTALAAKKKKGRRGPAGPQGPAGATGPAGPPGSAANVTPEPWKTVADNPLNGTDPCAGGQTAAFCGVLIAQYAGWLNFGSNLARAGFYKGPDGVVHLKGLVRGSAAYPETIFILPPSYRPSEIRLFSAICFNNTVGDCRIDVEPNGEVNYVVQTGSPGANGYLSLEGISFRVD